MKLLKEYTAGNYGTRKRSGGVSTLICAVLDDRHTEDGEPRSGVLVVSYQLLQVPTHLSGTVPSYVLARA